jgi:UDP-N-acetylglucosamine 2-epimerase (non-hydrolysing)
MTKKIKVMTVFGTRPEAIKMAPIVKLMQESDLFTPIVVLSSQHTAMLTQVTDLFNIKPDYDLDVMKAGQDLAEMTVKIIGGLDAFLKKERPDIVLVHGDTATTLGASMASFFNKIQVGHVEAGLRTWDKWAPYPEEVNRQMTDDISDLYFAPTELSRANLIHENHDYKKISVTGNTAIDTLRITSGKVDTEIDRILPDVDFTKKVLLLTMHRRENWGQPTIDVSQAVKQIIDEHDDVEFVIPVHLNPKVRKIVYDQLADTPRVHLIDPLNVFDFHELISRSYFILSDSGGVQEEAPYFHKPVLVLRDMTERPEGVTAGTLKLVGTTQNNVYQEISRLLNDQVEYDKMAKAKNPYGDGYAADRILDIIAQQFG